MEKGIAAVGAETSQDQIETPSYRNGQWSLGAKQHKYSTISYDAGVWQGTEDEYCSYCS